MKWQDTIIKQTEFEWKSPKFKQVDDNKLDIIVTIPLQSLIEAQAKRSFQNGVIAMLYFTAQAPEKDGKITTESLLEQFKEWEMPENILRQIKEL
jgi:hypothetical protein